MERHDKQLLHTNITTVKVSQAINNSLTTWTNVQDCMWTTTNLSTTRNRTYLWNYYRPRRRTCCWAKHRWVLCIVWMEMKACTTCLPIIVLEPIEGGYRERFYWDAERTRACTTEAFKVEREAVVALLAGGRSVSATGEHARLKETNVIAFK